MNNKNTIDYRPPINWRNAWKYTERVATTLCNLGWERDNVTSTIHVDDRTKIIVKPCIKGQPEPMTDVEIACLEDYSVVATMTWSIKVVGRRFDIEGLEDWCWFEKRALNYELAMKKLLTEVIPEVERCINK